MRASPWSLPASWSALTSLDTFTISYNKLTGTIPTEYNALSYLTTVNFGFNQLSGWLPPKFPAGSTDLSFNIESNSLFGSFDGLNTGYDSSVNLGGSNRFYIIVINQQASLLSYPPSTYVLSVYNPNFQDIAGGLWYFKTRGGAIRLRVGANYPQFVEVVNAANKECTYNSEDIDYETQTGLVENFRSVLTAIRPCLPTSTSIGTSRPELLVYNATANTFTVVMVRYHQTTDTYQAVNLTFIRYQ